MDTSNPDNGSILIQPATGPIRGSYDPPGDRSITHRALILGSLTDEDSEVCGSLECEDTVCTRRVLAQLGQTFTSSEEEDCVTISLGGLQAPSVPLDCGRSFTTLKLMLGLLATQEFDSVLTGSPELLQRRVTHLVEPLRAMGAEISCEGIGDSAPLRISGRKLKAGKVEIAVRDAELKSTLLLASPYMQGQLRIVEKAPSRDHSERLMKHMGIAFGRDSGAITLECGQLPKARRIKIAGDMSSAAPFIAATVLIPGSELTINQVGFNPGRCGMVKVLSRVEDCVERTKDWQLGSEPVTSLHVRHCVELPAFNIAPNLSPSMADELPLLALMATQATGTSYLRGINRLATRMPDRFLLTAQILRSFGADIELEEDGFTIHGPTQLHGGPVQCAGDHRLVMMATVAALIANGESTLYGADSIRHSYPGFFADLKELLVVSA
ncbi:3-phosphoshikimate 1-carboxyvinyltransferase [bacterium]|nr:3-phosphoshikimate 1-carboxyvinyltransferase [bacterium]